MEMNEQQIAKLTGCTVEQVRAQQARNASMLAGMLDKATATGRKVNGYTADELRTMHSAATQRAVGVY